MKVTPSIGSKSSRSSAMMVPSSSPAAAGELAPHVLAPGARGRPQVDHQLPGPDQLHLLVDFLELVRGAGTVALLLGQLHVRIGEVVMQPRLVNLLALGLDLHCPTIIRRCLPSN
jgi:hypothetical protein